MAGLVLAQSCRVVWLAQEAAVPVTERGRTERRILRRPMGYGLAAQPPGLVQGSSRRITIVRFRPADIRVINRRSGLSSCHPFCDFRAGPSFVKKIPPGSTSRLTRSPHIRTGGVGSVAAWSTGGGRGWAGERAGGFDFGSRAAHNCRLRRIG